MATRSLLHFYLAVSANSLVDQDISPLGILPHELIKYILHWIIIPTSLEDYREYYTPKDALEIALRNDDPRFVIDLIYDTLPENSREDAYWNNARYHTFFYRYIVFRDAFNCMITYRRYMLRDGLKWRVLDDQMCLGSIQSCSVERENFNLEIAYFLICAEPSILAPSERMHCLKHSSEHPKHIVRISIDGTACNIKQMIRTICGEVSLDTLKKCIGDLCIRNSYVLQCLKDYVYSRVIQHELSLRRL